MPFDEGSRAVKFSQSPLLSQGLPAWRSRLLLLGLLAAFALLVGWSVYLQGFNSVFLQEKGASRYSRVIELSANRGRIMDRHGDVLAVSTPVKSVWAIPEDAKLNPGQLRALAGLLELDVRELARKLGSDADFVFVKRQIPPDLAERVAALKLPGIHDQREYRRYYPSAEVTAHMLGFTGAEDVESIRAPQDGRDVLLALDAKIQYLAHSNLRQAIAENRAKAGGIVVLDAKTGEILALVNAPTYNPNNRVKLAGAQLRNRALTDTFEPWSTLKPFTAALALEAGKYRADTLIQTAPGRLTIGSATIHDAHMHGMLSVAQVIQKSSNVGAAKMALSLPPQEMWAMLDSLGFGSPLKLGFPGEVGGRLRPFKKWQPIEQATMAYGHGISVTLMQLARAYLVFARDGDLLPLSLTRLELPPAEGRPVFSKQTAHEVRAMLEMAVLPGGTAPKAQIAGYRVAGKTGTAHKIESGVYADKYIASFVGFAPASDPRLIVAVMIDEPAGAAYYGGDVAAPVFARVMAASLRALGVAPDAPGLQASLESPAVRESM